MIFLFLLYFVISSINVKYVESKIDYGTNFSNSPIVETQLGNIRGVRADDGDYNMFMGIPYAKVNESNIFGNSVPNPRFEEIFDANDDSAKCPQIEEFNFTTTGSLDCLTLNIYVPDSASSQSPLPVMAYIYGGGFSIGFAGRFMYGPKYIVRHDVILVTINYRLGPYGFMCLDKPDVSGNQGLKDQVAALRWIKTNIRSFGGDPDKITVFGNSAGGISVGLHLISDSEILFTNAITQSGSAFLPIVGDLNPSLPLTLAGNLGYDTNNTDEALAFLSSADVYSVIEASANILLGPCIENEFSGVERFLSQIAINSNHSKVANITMLIGFNSDETLSAYGYQDNSEVFIEWRNSFSVMLQNKFKFSEIQINELEGILRRFYIGDNEVNNEVRHEISQFSGDDFFVYPSIRSIKHFLNAGTEKVYQYLFSHDGERNFVKFKNNITEPGVVHADEIGYLFKMEFIPQEPNVKDQLVIDKMTAMWTNFAKYSDPTPDITDLLPVKWEPITKGSPYHYINIEPILSTGKRYENRRMSFWDLFYNAYAKYEVGFIDNDNNNDSDEETGSASVIYLSPILILAILIHLLCHINL